MSYQRMRDPPCNQDPCAMDFNNDACPLDPYQMEKSPRKTDKSTDSYTKFIKKHEKQLRKKHEEQKRKKNLNQGLKQKIKPKSMV